MPANRRPAARIRAVLRHPLTAALAAGLIAPDGLPPLGLWPLMPAMLAWLFLLLARAGTLARGGAIGWWFGLGYFCVGLNWIATAFTFQANMPAWLGWVAVVLLSLYLALFTGLATGAAWWLWRRFGRAQPIALAPILAGCWIAGEYLRATAFTGFAWNPVAEIWAGVPLMPQLVLPWAGTYGLSGLTMLTAALLAIGTKALAARWRAHPEKRGATALALAIPLAGATMAIGLTLIDVRHGPLPATGPAIRIVQPNIPQDEKWEEGASERNFARIARLTGRPGAAPRLIFWSESVVPWWIGSDDAARTAIADLLGPRDLLLLGADAVRTDAAGDPVAASNSLYAMDARGRLLGRYDKSHLVPYGEYLPMRPLLSAIGISRLAPGGLDFDAGPGPRNIMLPGIGPVGIQICYEITFSGRVVDPARRPLFLFNPSNDGWFGSWGPPQHLAQARLRAIEEGLPVIRATPTGISAIVAADGALVASLPWRTAGAIEGRLPAPRPPTLFARTGNALPMGLAALLVAAGFAWPRRRR